MEKNKYVVSLVYQKNNGATKDTRLESKIIEAETESKALGSYILESNNEFKEWLLVLKSVIKI